MVVLIGAISIYMFMTGLDQRKLSFKYVHHIIHQQDWKLSCTGNVSSVNFVQLYPHPLTFDRYSMLTLHRRSENLLLAIYPHN